MLYKRERPILKAFRFSLAANGFNCIFRGSIHRAMSERGTSSELLCVGSADGCVSISLNDSWTGKKLLDSIDHDYNLHMSPEEFQVRNTFIRTFALPFNVESHESIRNADADQLKSDFSKIETKQKRDREWKRNIFFGAFIWNLIFFFQSLTFCIYMLYPRNFHNKANVTNESKWYIYIKILHQKYIKMILDIVFTCSESVHVLYIT